MKSPKNMKKIESTKTEFVQNNGQAWVTYKDHPSALVAMQKLGAQKFTLEGGLVTGTLVGDNRNEDTPRP